MLKVERWHQESYHGIDISVWPKARDGWHARPRNQVRSTNKEEIEGVCRKEAGHSHGFRRLFFLVLNLTLVAVVLGTQKKKSNCDAGVFVVN